MRKRFDWFQLACGAVLLVFGVVLLYPVWYAAVASVTTQEAIETSKHLFPQIQNFWRSLGNYVVIFRTEGLFRSLWVTAVRFAYQFLVGTFLSVLLGFVFARMRFPCKNLIFLTLMFSMMIPGIAMTVPSYIFFASLRLFGPDGLINNPLLYFVTGLVNVYNIFLCRQMIATVGGEFQEAGEMDGAGFLRIVFQIYMPLVKPVIAVMFINMFAGHWSDYTTGLVYMLGRPEWLTIGYKVTELMDYYVGASVRDYPKMYAVSVVTLLPPIIAFLCVQNSFMEGLAIGGVKG